MSDDRQTHDHETKQPDVVHIRTEKPVSQEKHAQYKSCLNLDLESFDGVGATMLMSNIYYYFIRITNTDSIKINVQCFIMH